jgi:CMP-N,N'-diacetyllegionaminic acid synthase
MNILGLIPARGGSQRAPRKNIADLGGKPLIAWTIEAAKQSQIFTEIVVSTEDHEIATIAAAYGAAVLARPDILARAETPMLPVVKHAANEFPFCDVIVLLQPTSPFRSAEDIIKAATLLKDFDGDSVVSVTDVAEDVVFEIGHANRLREKTNFVTPNGAIYIITKEALIKGESWYSGLSYAYKMPKERSLDIDTSLDLEIARMMLRVAA